MKTNSLFAAALLAGNALAADLTLYAGDDYQGRALGVVVDERQLGVLNFDDRASSVVINKDAWILCSDVDYAGQCITLEPGRYPSLQALGLDKQVTSVRRRDPAHIGVFSPARDIAPAKDVAAAENLPPPGAEASDIVLFASSNFRGRSHTVEQLQPDLGVNALPSDASSVVIASGQWQLCGDAQFRGHCATLGPGKYPTLRSYGLETGVASVRRVSQPVEKVPAGN